jgi:hypothetical protein
MMKAESTSETSVNYYQATRRNNPEDSHRQVVAAVYFFNKMIFHFLSVHYSQAFMYM